MGGSIAKKTKQKRPLAGKKQGKNPQGWKKKVKQTVKKSYHPKTKGGSPWVGIKKKAEKKKNGKKRFFVTW